MPATPFLSSYDQRGADIKKKQQKNEKEKERRDRENDLLADLRTVLVKLDPNMQRCKLEKLDILKGARDMLKNLHQQQEIDHSRTGERTSLQFESCLMWNQLLQCERHRQMLAAENSILKTKIEILVQRIVKSKVEEKENSEPPKSLTPEPKDMSLSFSSPDSGMDISFNSSDISTPTSSRHPWRPW